MAQQHEVLERRNEILRRKIEKMLLLGNRKGLSRHDNQMLQRFIKEQHKNAHQIKQA